MINNNLNNLTVFTQGDSNIENETVSESDDIFFSSDDKITKSYSSSIQIEQSIVEDSVSKKKKKNIMNLKISQKKSTSSG